MNRTIRFGIAALLLLSVFLLARNQVAGAIPSPNPGLTSHRQEGQPVNVDLAKGTVKPPPHEIIIPVTGDYSIGGFCVLNVQLEDPNITLTGSLITPLPRELPDGVHKERQGCLLTYNESNQFLSELPPESGSTLICFAATPSKQMTVYFYDIYADNPTWVALETTTTAEVGIACAPANASGVYVATFTTP